MKIVPGFSNIGRRYRRCVLTTGIFDGVHKGHRNIIKEVVRISRASGRKSVVVTFGADIFTSLERKTRDPGNRGFLLTLPGEKAGLISDLGVDMLCVPGFSRDFSRISPEDFISRIALAFRPSRIVSGPSHSFGRDGAGNTALLKKLGKIHGFKISVPGMKKFGTGVVSSTAIRSLIRSGDVKKAAGFLGRLFSLKGTVVRGDGRGSSIGFPTANLEPGPLKLIPANGVYAVFARKGNRAYRGVMNIGERPTFKGPGGRISLEIFLIGHRGCLYGKKMRVDFADRIRNERRFKNTGSLSARIRKDIKKAIKILGKGED